MRSSGATPAAKGTAGRRSTKHRRISAVITYCGRVRRHPLRIGARMATACRPRRSGSTRAGPRPRRHSTPGASRMRTRHHSTRTSIWQGGMGAIARTRPIRLGASWRTLLAFSICTATCENGAGIGMVLTKGTLWIRKDRTRAKFAFSAEALGAKALANAGRLTGMVSVRSPPLTTMDFASP